MTDLPKHLQSKATRRLLRQIAADEKRLAIIAKREENPLTREHVRATMGIQRLQVCERLQVLGRLLQEEVSRLDRKQREIERSTAQRLRRPVYGRSKIAQALVPGGYIAMDPRATSRLHGSVVGNNRKGRISVWA